MNKIFLTIYYIYDAFVYRGTSRQIHGTGYSKEHALGVFAFLQLCNIVTLDNFFQTIIILKLPKWVFLLFAMALYFLNRYLFGNKKLENKPSNIMIGGAFIYAAASIALLCISFINIVPASSGR